MYLLLSNAELLPDGKSYFFSSRDVEVIMSMLYEHREVDLKELQTKEAGDLILQKAKSQPFPRHLPEFKLFE